MKNNSSLLFSKVFFNALLALIILVPTFLLPITINFSSNSKNFLVFFAALFTGALFFINSIRKQSWKIKFSPLTLPVLALGLSAMASTFFANQYPSKSLLELGGVLASYAVIVILGSSLLKISKNKEDLLIQVLMIAASTLSITGLMQLIGFGPSKLISNLTSFSLTHNLSFTLTGSLLTTIEIMVLALVAAVVKIINKKQISNLDIITIPLVLFGLGLHIWAVLPGKDTSIMLPSFSASWSVMLDSLRSPRNALIGQGPGYYQNAYAKFKPLWVNGQAYWQTRFTSASNFPMTLLASTGILGLSAWIFLIVKFFKTNSLKQISKEPVLAVIALTFLMQLFLPASTVLLALQAFLIAFWLGTQHQLLPTLKLEALSVSLIQNAQSKKTKNWLLMVINFAFLTGIVYVSILSGKAYSSFYHQYLANKAMIENDVVAVYEHQRIARNLNPYLAQFHRDYALTNLQIASALSNKTDATEEEQNQVGVLIQQAVNEARNAVSIDPTDSDNWVVLAQIYQNLISSNEEAEGWAINAYVSAIENEPNDPFKRIELGQILFQQEEYAQAANIYQQAINLKPDIPTGYYQLALALIKLEQYPSAQEILEQTLSLLPADSEDYQVVSKNLEEIKPLAEKAIQEASAAAQLNQETQDSTKKATSLGSELNSITEQNLESPNPGSQDDGALTELDLNEERSAQTEESNPETQAASDSATAN